MQRVKVSDNKRFLQYEDGSPFFYLADTAWELFHRLDKAETHRYLLNRAERKFNAVQAVALAEMDGLNTPNAEGNRPLIDNDPTKPNEAYFAHVDWTVDLAASMGIQTVMLPTWGDKWNHNRGFGPQVFTPENAFRYGAWMGRRYRDRPIIWMLGGDRPIDNDTHRQVIVRMAEGLREGDGGRGLITYHPKGGHGSSELFHDEPWLDFNVWQTGHARNSANYEKIELDYNRQPTKPTMDAEPGYEDHPSAFNLDNGYLDDYDIRKSLYWSVFAGACGYTYGSHPIWQFWDSQLAPKSFNRTHWEDAMQSIGARQLQHARALMESRPYFSRVPDQSMIVSEFKGGSHHVQATRDSGGSYAFVYCPFYSPVTLNLSKLSAQTLSAWWFDPRKGVSIRIADVERSSSVTFQPPQGYGPDWVLVLDDPSKNFGRPGASRV